MGGADVVLTLYSPGNDVSAIAVALEREGSMPRPAGAAHADQVFKAISGNEAATSAVAASWRRSANLYALDPVSATPSWRLSSPEIAAARARMGRLLQVAQPSLERLFFAVGSVGCSVMLADRDGVILERRGAAGDDSTFDECGLWTGAMEREVRGYERHRHLPHRASGADD